MTESFKKLVDLLKLDVSTSPWVQKQGIAGMFECLEAEVKEARGALYSKGPGAFQDEMGDILWTWIAVLLLTEGWAGSASPRDRVGVSIEGAIEDALQKLRRRKPWLARGEGFPEGFTAEDELREYEKVKAAEREGGWWSPKAEDRWLQLDRVSPVLTVEIDTVVDLTLDFMSEIFSRIGDELVPAGLIECIFMHPATWTTFLSGPDVAGQWLDLDDEGSGYVGSLYCSSLIVGHKVPINEVWFLANRCVERGEPQRVSVVVRIGETAA